MNLSIFNNLNPVNSLKNQLYMMQSTEYSISNYLRWLLRKKLLVHSSMKRGKLKYTKIVIVLFTVQFTIYFVILSGLMKLKIIYGIGFLLFSFLGNFILIILVMMLKLIAVPNNYLSRKKIEKLRKNIKAKIIVVAGSYGKSTMKEILYQTLKTDFKTVVSQGNRNTMVAHKKLLKKLQGDEQVIVLELGEAKNGDIKKFTKILKPDMAIVTGLAPMHMGGYKSIEQIRQDFEFLINYCGKDNSYIIDNDEELAKIKLAARKYNISDVNRRTTDIENKLTGLEFKLDDDTISIKLFGTHLIIPVMIAVDLFVELGGNKEKLGSVFNNLKPFDHRLEPREVKANTYIIDDTYNGNIESVRVGIKTLKDLQVDGQKIYATPGIVEQGKYNERNHIEIGNLLAQAKLEKVYLFRNSVTKYILDGMGEVNNVEIVEDAAKFYRTLPLKLHIGDVALLQNDWGDQYE